MWYGIKTVGEGVNTVIVTNIHANNCAKILFFQSSPPPILSQNR